MAKRNNMKRDDIIQVVKDMGLDAPSTDVRKLPASQQLSLDDLNMKMNKFEEDKSSKNDIKQCLDDKNEESDENVNIKIIDEYLEYIEFAKRNHKIMQNQLT